MKKKTAKTVATLALAGALLTSPLTAMAASFKDVGADHWAYSHISKLSDLRIIKGYDDGNYKPTLPVTYLEILELLKGVQAPSSTEMTQAMSTYGYVADAYKVPAWAKPAVCIALQNNVINEGNLKAAYKHNYIKDIRKDTEYPSRELAMVYYAKALGVQPKTDISNIKVTDINSIGKTSKELIGDVNVKGLLASMIDAGIFNGFGVGTEFKPNVPLQRDQMAKITDLSYDYRSTQSFEGYVVDNTVINNVATFSIKDKAGKTTGFVLNSNTAVTLNGKVGKLDDITVGSTVKVKAFAQGGGIAPYKAVSVDVIGNDAEGKGIVDSLKNDEIQISYSTKKDVVVDTSFKPEKTANFKFDKDTVITSLGKKIDKSAINVRDLVAFKSRNGILKEVMVYPYSGMVSGEFVNYEYNRFGISRIVLKLENKQEQDFIVKDEKVAKELFVLSQRINKGYPLTLSTRYHEVVSAKATKEDLRGILANVTLRSYNNEATIDITTQQGKRSYPLASSVTFKDEVRNTPAVSYKPAELWSALYDKSGKADLELQMTGGQVDKVTIKGEIGEQKSAVIKDKNKLDEFAKKQGFGGDITWARNSAKGYTAFKFNLDTTDPILLSNFSSGQIANENLVYVDQYVNQLKMVYNEYKTSDGQKGITNVRIRNDFYNKEFPVYKLGDLYFSK